jgi:hypothetical protein
MAFRGWDPVPFSGAEVVAYAANAALLCPQCAERRWGPDPDGCEDDLGGRVAAVLPWEEFDGPQYCDACGQRLDVRVLRDWIPGRRRLDRRVPRPA